MKQLISIIVLLICFAQYTQAQPDSIGILLTKQHSNTFTEPERKVLRTRAFDIQNRGQMLDEKHHDYKGSLILIDSAILLFNSLADTLNIANNMKFRGYLLGRFGKYEEGKAAIAEAIHLFTLKNSTPGIAVSQFDLALLYDFEGRPDSAIHYCNVAISYWKTKDNYDRIFLNQNLLIHVLTKSNDLEKAKLIQGESNIISQNHKQHWQNLLDFYFVSDNLYKAAEQFEAAENYQNLFSELVKELNSKGITARSYFEL